MKFSWFALNDLHLEWILENNIDVDIKLTTVYILVFGKVSQATTRIELLTFNRKEDLTAFILTFNDIDDAVVDNDRIIG